MGQLLLGFGQNAPMVDLFLQARVLGGRFRPEPNRGFIKGPLEFVIEPFADLFLDFFAGHGNGLFPLSLAGGLSGGFSLSHGGLKPFLKLHLQLSVHVFDDAIEFSPERWRYGFQNPVQGLCFQLHRTSYLQSDSDYTAKPPPDGRSRLANGPNKSLTLTSRYHTLI